MISQAKPPLWRRITAGATNEIATTRPRRPAINRRVRRIGLFRKTSDKAITSDDSVSTNGKNVKIITVDGVVTLRGPVKSEAEKTNIAAKAQQIAGVKNVENQLEIAN